MRRGFTLIEMLIALMILSVVGTAMVGTLFAATRLFELGERQRATADEAMTVIQIIDADIGSAVPRHQGGEFFAQLAADGNCIIGWTITNPDPRLAVEDAHQFVVWGIDGEELKRNVLDDQSAMSNPAAAVAAGTTTMQGCWYLGAFLAGAEIDGDGDLVPETLAALPADDWWQTATTIDGATTGPTEPANTSYDYDTALGDLRYPSALRLVVMLDAGRIRAEGAVVADDGGSNLRIAGVRQLPIGNGRILRIGDELIGYHGYANGVLRINDDPSHGPLGSAGTGRGAYRTTAPGGGHASGTAVRAGEVYTLIRTLPD